MHQAGPSASATDTNPEPDDIHKPTSSQNRLLLATVSREADRYGVSDRAAAAIATAALMDASPSFEVSHVSRKRLRFEVSATANTDRQVLGLYFDGRKDVTLVRDEITHHVQKRTEEHYVLVEQPGNVYIGHVVPDSGSSRSIFEAMTHAGITLDAVKVSRL